MSTRFESVNSEYAFRNSISISGNPITLAGYIYIHSYPAATLHGGIINISDNAFTGYGLALNSSGNLRFWDENGGNYSGTSSSPLSLSTWYYLWIRKPSGFSITDMYVNGSTTPFYSSSGGLVCSTTLIHLQFARHNDGSLRYGDISLCGWKLWNTDLAASNATAEMASHSFINTTNRIGSWEFNGTIITDGFGSNNLTASGTLSNGPDSPIDGGSPPPSLINRGLIGVGI